ncbi:NAD-dependent epimerase/dehydratase family protein [Octadecabacter sp. 1_MG-2023]|uniref:NAD-dependent epimerase/dehydratase family protein n=1 Tax=unclassified Octadecabacter TaxID=196158 RepID=UPI001C09D978|nr:MULTISPECIES: NAD-dependent epimerase/dehydratase family protein [unclassified Octadecabacter]MBU2994062.1 NAD-dependent epimerase/dehydratase family protein [Octadecabacter sp. B2R22]MDO6736084.1 NAD-dependent epimerase/dehydratase family protein [Octadecabacter sp. 1_MG-2023]
MKVLITGGAGFIGSHTADALLAKGHSVRVLDILQQPVHRGGAKPAYLDPEIELMIGDVRDEAALLAALRGVDAVYHLAAFQDYLPEFSRFFSTNVTSTALIYELILREKLPIQKVIVASSQAALGEGLYLDANGTRVLPGLRPDDQLRRGVWDIQASGSQAGPLQYQATDETVANPQNCYGTSKIAQEKVALNLGRMYGIPSVAMRYSIVQGPRQSLYNAYSGACRIFSLSFHVGRDPVLYEDGQQVRDFVNYLDVVDANLHVLEDDRANYEMFNVGGDRAITVAEFASTVAQVFGRNDYVPDASGKYRFGDTRHILSDVSKLKALGWAPGRSTFDSVSAYRDWMEDAAPAEDILEQSDKMMAALGVVRTVDAG